MASARGQVHYTSCSHSNAPRLDACSVFQESVSTRFESHDHTWDVRDRHPERSIVTLLDELETRADRSDLMNDGAIGQSDLQAVGEEPAMVVQVFEGVNGSAKPSWAVADG